MANLFTSSIADFEKAIIHRVYVGWGENIGRGSCVSASKTAPTEPTHVAGILNLAQDNTSHFMPIHQMGRMSQSMLTA